MVDLFLRLHKAGACAASSRLRPYEKIRSFADAVVWRGAMQTGVEMQMFFVSRI